MADTFGSLVDKLCTVDLKMWNMQEKLYKIRHMTFGEFQIHLQNLENMEEIYNTFKNACDLNYQRSCLIDEMDQLLLKVVEGACAGECLDKYVQKKHKTY